MRTAPVNNPIILMRLKNRFYLFDRLRLCLLIFFLFSTFYLLSFTSPIHAARTELIYDGNFIQRTDIVKFNGIDYIFLKSIAALFRGKTQWYPIAGKVTLQLNNQKITFDTDSRVVTIGNKKMHLSSPTRVIKGKIYVPVEFFLTENFMAIADCKVSWNPENHMITAEPRVSLFLPRIYTRARLTRIVLESAEEMSPDVKKKKKTIVVEIPKARIASEENIKIKNQIVDRLKMTQQRRSVLIKIDLTKDVTTYSWHQEKNPNRMVLDIHHPEDSQTMEDEKFPEVVLPVTKVSTPQAPSAQPTQTTVRPASQVKKIVVDAGHGGKDPGAIGRKGTKEKDINLLIALELARILEIEGGYDVLLTRSSDTFISLIDRTLFANEHRADLFISIHCNASLRKAQEGFEIYFLADEASDSHAEAAAELENAVIELEGPSSPKKQRLQELLFSMARTEFINDSSLLCSTIARDVEKRVPIENRGVKQANFHVLHGAQMPCTLVECAFLTQSSEEQKLRKKKFRSALVDAIFTGIEDYQRQVQLLYKSR